MDYCSAQMPANLPRRHRRTAVAQIVAQLAGGQHRELKPIQRLRFLFVWFGTRRSVVQIHSPRLRGTSRFMEHEPGTKPGARELIKAGSVNPVPRQNSAKTSGPPCNNRNSLNLQSLMIFARDSPLRLFSGVSSASVEARL